MKLFHYRCPQGHEFDAYAPAAAASVQCPVCPWNWPSYGRNQDEPGLAVPTNPSPIPANLNLMESK